MMLANGEELPTTARAPGIHRGEVPVVLPDTHWPVELPEAGRGAVGRALGWGSQPAGAGYSPEKKRGCTRSPVAESRKPIRVSEDVRVAPPGA